MPDKEVPWTRSSKGGEPSTLIACVIPCQIRLALIRLLPFPVHPLGAIKLGIFISNDKKIEASAVQPVPSYRAAIF